MFQDKIQASAECEENMKGSTIKAVFSYKGYEVQISTIIESDNIGLFEAINLLLMVVKDRTGGTVTKNDSKN